MEVREELERQWSFDGSNFAAQTRQRVTKVTSKAWGYAGEMEKIAATFAKVGLPGGFHEAASDLYHRMAGLRGRTTSPELSEVLDIMLSHSE